MLLLALTMVIALPFSATGTRLLIAWVNDSGLLRVEYAGGSLFGDLDLDLLQIEVDGVELQLDRVKTQLDLDCFWISTFCLNTLEVESLTLDISASDSEQASANPVFFQSPFAVQIDKLVLGAAAIDWPGGSWRQALMNAELKLSASKLVIASVDISAPVLQVDASERDDSQYTGFDPSKIFIPLDVSVSQLNLMRPRLEIGDIEQSLDNVALSGRWQGYDLTLNELAVAEADLGRFATRGTLTFDDAWPINLRGEWAIPQQIESVIVAGRTLDVSLRGNLGELLIAANSEGLPDFKLSMNADLLSNGLPHKGDAELNWPEGSTLGEMLALEGALASAQILGPAQMQVQGTLDTQAIELSAQLEGLGYQSLALLAKGRWASPRLLIESLTLRDESTDSMLTASGVAEIAETWSVQTRVESEGFNLPSPANEALGRLDGELALLASGNNSGWSVSWQEMNITGEVNGLAASAQGSAGLDSRLRLLPGKTRIELNGALLDISALQNDARDAYLNLKVDDLGRWVTGARGRISLRGTGGFDRERIQLSGEARDFKLGEVVMDAAELSLDYNGALDSISADIRSSQIESQSYRLSDLSAELKGTLASHRLRLATQGDIAGQLIVAGRWKEGEWQGELQPTTLQTGSGPWRLNEPVALAWVEEGIFNVNAHCWRHSEFDLCSEDAEMGASGALQLSLQGDIKAFNGLLPNGMQLQGDLSSTVDIAWEPEASFSLEGVLKARELRTTRRYGKGERVDVTWQAIDLELQRQGAGLALDARVLREGRQVLSVAVILPTSSQGPLSGDLIFTELQLATLVPWLPEISQLAGSLTGKLSLAGSPAEPNAQGRLRLEQAEVGLVSNPTQLKALALDLTLNGQSAVISGSGLLGGGKVELKGQVLAHPQLRVELAVSGDHHQILVPPSSEILVSEELTLVLTQGLLDVRGEVRVHEGVLRHKELPVGSVGLSREVVIVDTLGNVIENESPFDVSVDIWLRIRDRFRVEGEGVRATLGGELHVTQVPGEEPQVFGSLNVIAGELEAYRQRLQVRRGRIAFTGPSDNPELDIMAEREIRADDVTVGARLQGRLDEPVLEVYSNPPMPQGETMSYLVRGRGLDSGADADGTALALSVGADVVNRSGIVAELNRLPLLSDVSFGASGGEDDTAATVSGYIGNRLYLAYGRGLYEPINELTARLYLQSRLWLEVVSRLENSVDLYYSFDID